MKPSDVVAIVLAGGASSRFGSDKLAAPLNGRPLLHHALEAVAEVVDRIVVVIAPGVPLPPVPEALAGRVDLARDTAAFGGPLAGLASGLAADTTPIRDEAPRITGVGDEPRRIAAVGDEAPRITGAGDEAPRITVGAGRGDANRVALIVGGDMPSLVPAVLRLLIDRLVADPSLVAMTLAASCPAPLPMVVRPDAARTAIDAILASGGRRSLRALLETVRSATLPGDQWLALDPTGATLRDVDTPADISGP